MQCVGRVLCASILGFAVFLACSNAAPMADPVSGPGGISKRSVAEQQFMNDKGKMLKELGRRLWMHSMVSELHTAPRTRNAVSPQASSSGGRAGFHVALHRSLRHADQAHGQQPEHPLAHPLDEDPMYGGTIP